jgi:Bacteriophage head to tail connecting protein
MNAMTPAAAFEGGKTTAEGDIARWAELKTERSQHEQLWTDIARLIRPQRGGFGLTDPAGRQMEKPLSSAPIHAHGNFAAGLYGTLTNPANRWCGLATNDPDDMKVHENALWLDTASNRVLASFQPSVSTFYTAAQQVYGDIAAFGNAAQFDELQPAERRILDVTISLAEICYDIDAFGLVVEVVRRFMLTAEQAIGMFRQEGDRLPTKLTEMAQKGDRTRMAFYQRIGRNDAFRPGRLGAAGKRWYSRYSTECDSALIRVKGYDEMPFYAPRWDVDTGHTYGTGPAFAALASTRLHNRMTDSVIRAAQRAADPTILAPDRGDWPLNGQIQPGKVVYGAMNMQGQPMLQPLDVSGRLNLTLQERQEVMQEIRDAFHYTLMNLAGRTGMTATEVMAITEERQRLWAPHQGRLQEEYLARKVARRFAMLWKAGQIPPPPEGLKGKELTVIYKSAAAAAQQSFEGNAALRILQDIAPLAQISPAAAERLGDRLDPDGMLEVLMQARGAPASLLRSREDADALAEGRNQRSAAAQTVGTMQAGAGMLKDLAGAQAQMAPQGVAA